MKRTREFVITSLNEEEANEPPDPDFTSGWVEVTAGRGPILGAVFMEFGFAEETIALFLFKDGTAHVGVGEPLRPYQVIYDFRVGQAGMSHEEAFTAFWKEASDHVFSEVD